MNDFDTSRTSILLPDAYVTLFTNDSKTEDVFLKLEDDWRFARVKMDSHKGDVHTAIEYYGTYESPDLIIVQTDTINEDFSNLLENLAAQCSENTTAIVIGPDNDVDLYRKLIAMGVSDYLVKPLDKDKLAHNIGKTLLERIGEAESRLVSVVGTKGGVGASMIAQTLARGSANSLKQKTFLMDASGGWSSMSVGMGLEPSTTLLEAVKAAESQNEDSLSRMIFKASDKLSVLSTGADMLFDNSVDADTYEKLIDYLMQTYPVLFVDLSAAPQELKRIVINRSQHIIAVTSPLLTSVRAARTLIQEIKDLRGNSLDQVSMVLNMKGISPKQEVPKVQIEEGLDIELDLEIQYDPDTFLSTESEGKGLTEHKNGKKIEDSLLGLIKHLISDKSVDPEGNTGSKDTGKKGSLLGKLLKKD